MKTLKHTLLIGMMMAWLAPHLFAQSFDADRMNKDLKIMENILDEMFKIDGHNNIVGSEFRILPTGTSGTYTQGTYIPDYGVIFKIPQVIYAGFSSIEVNKKDGNNRITFYYDDEDGKTKAVTKESITNRITEFLEDYAANIAQLKPDEKVMVIYGIKGKRNRFFIVQTGDSPKAEQKQKPVISVTARMKNLNDYRKQQISNDEFTKQLQIQSSENKEFLDLKVMANVFQTAFEGKHNLAFTDENSEDVFRLVGDVSYQKLNDFGVIFSMDARYASNLSRAFFQISKLSSKLKSISIGDRMTQDKEGNIKVSRLTDPDSTKNIAWKQQEEKGKEQALEALTYFKNLLKEYLVDYGRTLRSIKPDERILLTVDINRTNLEYLPQRLLFQIKKSMLGQFDEGHISREKALQAVTITEY